MLLDKVVSFSQCFRTYKSNFTVSHILHKVDGTYLCMYGLREGDVFLWYGFVKHKVVKWVYSIDIKFLRQSTGRLPIPGCIHTDA